MFSYLTIHTYHIIHVQSTHFLTLHWKHLDPCIESPRTHNPFGSLKGQSQEGTFQISRDSCFIFFEPSFLSKVRCHFGIHGVGQVRRYKVRRWAEEQKTSELVDNYQYGRASVWQNETGRSANPLFNNHSIWLVFLPIWEVIWTTH